MDKMSLAIKYENNRLIRPLLQLIPCGIGSGIDSFLTITLNRMRQERAEVFFDELSKGNIDPDNDYLKTDDYVHKYILMMKYVLNTKQKEKIVMFANIFKNSFSINDKIMTVDVFEDFSGILNELSFREISALAIFESYNTIPRDAKENDIQWVNKFWDAFEERMEKELNVPKSYVNNFMIRITRTGCYEEFNGNYFGYTGGKGKLTPLYYELKHYIVDNVE
jgi:hypothetical protein